MGRPVAKSALADQLATIAEHAATLRQAGVTEITTKEGLSFKLSPHVEEPEPTRPEDEKPDPVHAADDPATFGLKPGSRPPGRRWVEEKQ